MKQIVWMLLLLAQLKCSAQDAAHGLGVVIAQSTYIVEATVLKRTILHADADDQPTASAVLRIHKVLKGNLQCGTVELLSAGGDRRVRDSINGQTVIHLIPRGRPEAQAPGFMGIFICSVAPGTMNGAGELTDNKDRLFLLSQFEYHIDDNHFSDKLVIAYGHQFDSVEDFYHFLQGDGKVKLKDCDHQVFRHVPRVSTHDYRMTHDPVYRHEVDSIDSAHAAYKEQMRIKREEDKNREEQLMPAQEMQMLEARLTKQEQQEKKRREKVPRDSVYIYLPESFTPNENGLNDVLLPVTRSIAEWRIMVFNRWGELVFSTDDVKQGWNGMYKGRYAASGVYVYKISYTDRWQRKGTSGGKFFLQR